MAKPLVTGTPDSLGAAGRWLGLLGWLAVCALAAAIGATFQAGGWYAGLEKPPGTPPNWVFPLVWTVLYALMAFAAWRVWERYTFAHASGALSLFLIQLLFNALWSWLFFGLGEPGLALVDIMLLWVALSATVVAFWRKLPLAGALLLPYWLWTSFAVYLNYGIWSLNS